MNEELFLLFRDAFPESVPPPRPVTRHRCPECDEVESLMGGRAWPEFAAAFPDYCHDVFPLLTPAARAYFLPAYMLTSLGTECGMQGTSVEFALSDGQLDPAAFTPFQRAAVRRWATAYWNLIDKSEPPADLIARWR